MAGADGHGPEDNKRRDINMEKPARGANVRRAGEYPAAARVAGHSPRRNGGDDMTI